MAYVQNRGRLNPLMNEEEVLYYTNAVKHSQIYLATHNGAGVRLPSRNLSFISFSFGGKNIEDFELIACCEGDTMRRNAYANFDDLVSSYDIIDGLYYHGTIFKPNTLSLKLVSDAIDEKKLTEFLHWFLGGRTRELILAEHPNRAIMARVSSPPQLDVTPYEKPIEVYIGGQLYTTSTTLYKGFITLDLVADKPFWYAKQNILIRNVTSGESQELFLGINIFNNEDLLKEALKVMYEDNIPSSESVMNTMHFGTTQFVTVGGDSPFSIIMLPINRSDPTAEPEGWAQLSTLAGYFTYIDDYVWDEETETFIESSGQTWYVKGACIEGRNTQGQDVIGRIAGPTSNEEGTDPAGPLVSGMEYNFFYGGTAPSPTILTFGINMQPISGSLYLNCIANAYAPVNNKEYSTITIESVHKKEFDFTIPNVMASYNKAVKIFSSISDSNATAWGDVSDTLRDLIRHPAVRAWCISCINNIQSNNNSLNTGAVYLNDNGTITSYGKSRLLELLGYFFLDVNGNWPIVLFTFDAEQCIALGMFSYWKAANSSQDIVSVALAQRALANDPLATPNADVIRLNYITVTENVGDMIRSNWLIIEDHNEFTEMGLVSERSTEYPLYCHTLTHNAPVSLLGLRVLYKNMYL